MNQAASPTTLHQPYQTLARIAWLLIVAVTLLLFLISTLETLRTPLPACSTPGANCPVSVQVTLEDYQLARELGLPFHLLHFSLIFSLGARLSLALVSLIIFWRKSDDWVALFMSAALVTVLLEGAQTIPDPIKPLYFLMFGIGTTLFIPIPFIFPSGVIQPRWLRLPVIFLALGYGAAVTLGYSLPAYANIQSAFALLWVLGSLYAMPYRYFRLSTPVERQQIKWVLVGLGALFVSSVYYSLQIVVFPISQPSEARLFTLLVNLPIYFASYSFFAFSMLVAMLRYRLWDIDFILRRTLVYTSVTGILALVYFGGVAVIQSLFTSLSGQESPIAVVLSTLGIAALFNPLRRRIQNFIDRRFYRQKYNADQALAQFAAAARTEVDIQRLSGELIAVVDTAIRPERLNLWLRPAAVKLEKSHS